MNLKALEDLVNILVKKAGKSLNDKVDDIDLSRTDERAKKITKEINKLKDQLSKKAYFDSFSKDKDEREKDYLDNKIRELENNLRSLENEFKAINKENESGESTLSILLNEEKALKEYASSLQQESEFLRIEGSKEYDEVSSKYSEVLSNLSSQRDTIDGKISIKEDMELIKSEILSNKKILSEIEARLEKNDYVNYMEKRNDELTLSTLEAESKVLNDSLDYCSNNVVALGKEIIGAYEKNKDYKSIEKSLDRLIHLVQLEYKKTQKEIKATNIFEVMDKYSKLSNSLETRLVQENYFDSDKSAYLAIKQEYYSSKILNNKKKLIGIEERKEEVKTLIESCKILADDIKKSRLDLEADLLDKEKRMYLSFSSIDNEELKSIDKLIIGIKNDIEKDKLQENEYLEDYLGFKEEYKNLELNYHTIEEYIKEEEKILQKIDKDISDNTDEIDRVRLFEDKLTSIEYSNKYNSMSNQQQYLYVDINVIRDEIKNLWAKRTNEDIKEVEEQPEIISLDDDLSLADNELPE